MLKISVITATFNSGKTLRDTIGSVLRQSYPNIEHIIVDGGSKDDTIEIIKKYEPRYDGRRKWISEPDIGILNSDDFYTSTDVAARLAEVLENTDADAVYGDIHYVNDENLEKCVRYYSSRKFRRWKMRLGWMPAHPSFYCRKSIYEKYGSFDISFKIGADFENLLRLIFVGRIKIVYVPLDCVTMRTGGASTQGFKSHRQILSDHLRAYRKNGVRSGIFLESMRYIEKIWEMVCQKIAIRQI